MPSSTSSSERLPRSSAWPALLAAFAGAVLLVLAGEWALARRGYIPTALDSMDLWVARRNEVAREPRALVVLGSSRAQVGIDLDTLARRSGRHVIQLAIDNTSFLPVLAGLADDPEFRGAVLVDYLERFAMPGQRDQTALAWQAAWERQRHLGGVSPSALSEAWLGDALRSRLRLYADGAQPLTSLLTRVLDPAASPQYLVIRPDRSREADYARTDLPPFYYRTVARYLDVPLDRLPWDAGLPAVESALRKAVDALPEADAAAIDAGIARASALAQRIEARGGRVWFVRMPSCGLIREAEQRLYPRERYWARLAEVNPGGSVHFQDHPALAGVDCPDGSHLDRRDVPGFTNALVDLLPGLAD